MMDSDRQILRVNMSTLSTKWEKVPEEWRTLGGRGLTSTIVAKEVPPLAHPLGENNKFIVAPGIVTGTTAPTSGRLSVGGKSPLTGGIKEANAGGRTPHKLARAGVKALVIEGKPSDNDVWYNLEIRHNDAKLVQANEYHMMGAYQIIHSLWEKYQTKPGIIGAGPAGQLLLKGAGIFGNNIENNDPGRYAGRGGLGAVLGSKRVIAIISDDSDGGVIKPIDEEKFKAASKALTDALREHPVTGTNGGLQNYGTNILQNIINEAGALPTRNWRYGHFEGASKISGEAVHEFIDNMKEKFGDEAEATYAHPCHPGCAIKCSNAVPYEENGKLQVSPLEYETAWALGTNLTIDNLRHVAELNRLCNDLGLDTIETGNALAVAMEAGIIPFGDGEAAIKLLKEVKEGTPLGRIIGSGAVEVGNLFGVERVAAVKGQSMPAYDPRPIRGIGVTYATGPMGADHTQGYTIAAEILGIKGEVTDPRDIKKAQLSRLFQETTAFIDSSGYCLFTAFAILDIDSGFKGLVETVEAVTGETIGLEGVAPWGRKILNTEIEFNRKAGFTKAHDRLPEFMKKEPLPPHNVVFDVPDEELDQVHEM